MKISLARLPAGIPATVISMSCDKVLTRRLLHFGLRPDTSVTVCYRSPYGGVTALRCRGAVIALRTKDVKKIQVRLS